MKKDFLLVSRKILPEYLDKVIYARNLLTTHEASSITEAVHMAGISRNTYYKYKDVVYEPSEDTTERKAVISMILKNEAGTLSSVLKTLSDLNTSILTISQAIPISHKANVLISLDISHMSCEVEELISTLKEIKNVRSVKLDAIE